MQLLKQLFIGTISTALGIGLFVATAQAGDKRVVVGTKRHVYPAPVVVTNYPNTIVYGRTPQVVYQGAPTVIITTPIVRPRPYNYYRQWSNGWRNQPQRYGQPRYCPPKRSSQVGHYRGRYQRRW